MRVTDGMRQTATRQAQGLATERLHRATNQAVTGKRVNAPQDDPASFARITKSGAGIGRWESRSQALSQAEGDSLIAESSLASASDIMSRLKEIAVQMADGTATSSDRAISAKEVTQLRQQLVDIGNTRGATGYLFGGTATDTAPFNTAGVFSGNDNAISIETSDGVNVRKNASGANAFTAAGGRDILADAAALEAALTANNVTGIQAAIDATSTGHSQLVRARTETGLQLDRMRMAQDVASEATLALKSAHANDSEVDITEAFTSLADAQQGYERSIEIARRTLAMFDIKNM
jgi:flagellar hook-associated protein 3 FlgL